MEPIRWKQLRKRPTHFVQIRSRRPRLELLEERLQPGETILFGISALALWSPASDLVDPPLPAEHGECSISCDSLTTPAAHRWAAGLRAVDDLVFGVVGTAAIGSEFASTGDLDDQLAVGAANRQLGVSQLGIAVMLASATFSNPGFEMKAIAGISSANSGEQPSPFLQPDGVTSGTLLFGATHSVAAELAPGSTRFHAAIGQLAIRTDGQDNTVRQTLTHDGFLEVTLDGRAHSSDPTSAAFDPDLAGASGDTLAGIRFDGSGQDELILDHDQLAGGLAVSAAGVRVKTEDVVAAGPLTIQAQNITVSHALRGSGVALGASGLLSIEADGNVTANGAEVGGRIELAADVLVNAGQVHADGVTGGQVLVQGRNVLNAGPVTAEGSTGAGGTVKVSFTAAYIDTTSARNSASSATGPGGHVVITGGTTGRLYSSGQQVATGWQGGAVNLFGRNVVLAATTVDASGNTGGGAVLIGGDLHGRNLGVVNAQTVTITGATTIRANSLESGRGGRVAVWSDRQTELSGSIAARGGPIGGDGGFIEVSGKGNLSYGGSSDAGARLGKTGRLLLDPKTIIISEAPVGVFPQFDLIDPHPTQGGGFGTVVSVLSTGNIAVANPNDNFGGTRAGAVYLFHGLTGTLISALVGGNPNDRVGERFNESSVVPLSNGNYVVRSPAWNGNRGAVSWGSSATGVSGVVSSANSLVGTNLNDSVGFDTFSPGVIVLANDNYLVNSPSWNGRRGAVTWGNGTNGVRGAVSAENSLVGSNPEDRMSGFIFPLNNGNYAVSSPRWNGDRGAVTWGNGTGGTIGPISANNSFVGSDMGDLVGAGRFTALPNGNYVVGSIFWNANRGAVTWGNGTGRINGPVGADNSLVGTDPNDRIAGDTIGVGGITPLANSNYVVRSPFWNQTRGAATWGSGMTGLRGIISADRSLIGTNVSDHVGAVAALPNGNYVVVSSEWNSNRGAVTWANGATGVQGFISSENSLVGTMPNDQLGTGCDGLRVLRNGDYVVASPEWNNLRGAVTWASGTHMISGMVSPANSLVGDSIGDRVGLGCVTELANGNALVASPIWSDRRGAITWSGGMKRITGVVSSENSLVGSNPQDFVGNNVIPLSGGNYVTYSPFWNSFRGAVTWGSGANGVRGIVSEQNSLVGTDPNDSVALRGVTLLNNGNYVVDSPSWNDGRGAVTWSSGTSGVRGRITADNSLVGATPGDEVGGSAYGGGVFTLVNGNYVVGSPSWNGARGAVTRGNGLAGIPGTVSSGNSLFGTNAQDLVGSFITPLSSGNFVARSFSWSGNRGAVTWGSGTSGITGAVSAQNSLVGSIPADNVGGELTVLPNGNYVVRSTRWNDFRGAATWGSGTAGVRGIVSVDNSLVGNNPNDQLGSDIRVLSNGNYLIPSSFWNGNRGAVTWVSAASGQTLDGSGHINLLNSIVGRAADAGPGAVLEDQTDQSFAAAFVTDGGGRVSVGLPDPNQFSYARGQAQTVTLTPDFLTRTLNTGTAVVLQASNDITVNSPITVSAGGAGGSLTLQAGRSVVLNANITTDNGNLTLIANDRLANGVVNSQRDPGNAFITMALGTSLNTGTGALAVELRDGAGLTYRDSGAISLTGITAGSATIINNGPSPGSDIRVGTVATSGAQSYADANGATHVFGDLTAQDAPITFTNSVVVNDGHTVDAGITFVAFASSALQLLAAGNGVRFGNVSHTGTGILQLTNPVTVTGQLTNAAGTFDANDQPVNVTRLTSVTGGAYLAGTAQQTFEGGLLVAGGVFTSSSSGPMTVAGPVAVADGLLSGQGTLDSLSAIRGTVAPGTSTSPGILAVAGAVSLFSSVTLRLRLDGPKPGSEYSQLQAVGPVSLYNSALSLLLGFKPEVGTSFEVLSSATGPILGAFDGLPEGMTFQTSGFAFQITYRGGYKGNSVLLTRLK